MTLTRDGSQSQIYPGDGEKLTNLKVTRQKDSKIKIKIVYSFIFYGEKKKSYNCISTVGEYYRKHSLLMIKSQK